MRLTHILTVRTRDGSPLDDPINKALGQGSATIGVYGRKDKDARLKAAEDRPDLQVTVRRARRSDRRT